ncbi:hypothetical protein [Salmonella phage SD-6_S16]|nr:hypothetical protein [Salmonella phage SD-6_S16]
MLNEILTHFFISNILSAIASCSSFKFAIISSIDILHSYKV